MQLLIYTPTVSPRIKYIFNFIFREILLGDFEFCHLEGDFFAYPGPKMSYAKTALGNELFFEKTDFLDKNSIEQLELSTVLFKSNKVPFAVSSGALPFDLFAASFYLVSRYEEYLPHLPDAHGRYQAESSFLYQNGLLDMPIVDQWALALKKILLQNFIDLSFKAKKYEFIPTIDIDRAYHFKANGWLRNAARLIKALATADTERLGNMTATATGKRKDPFDTYDYLNSQHDSHQLGAIYFFLLVKGGHPRFDMSIDPSDRTLQQLIATTANRASVGIHPSYASNSQPIKLGEEIKRLSDILGKKISLSRQHFLKLSLPKTYLQLLKANIDHDYTMGYASQIGFRAGTCTPFFWYDLQLGKQTSLKVHPFAVMDVTLRQYLKLSPNEAKALLSKLVAEVRAVNGTFYSLWHNESVSETGVNKGWRTVYEHLLKEASL